MRRLLAALGDPQLACPYVHIAGTNGKGSTTAMTASILNSAGLRVGRFTSPHLHRWEERIAVDGEPVAGETFVAAVARVRAAADAISSGGPEQGIVQFEALTAAAFVCFGDRRCDAAVLEVGLGGRFDATNVITNPVVTVITTIGHDHTQILGEDLASIAREKAGIIKPGVPVVTAALAPEALSAIREIAAQREAPCWVVRPEVDVHPNWDVRPDGDEGTPCFPEASPAWQECSTVRWRRLSQGVDGQTFSVELSGRSYRGLRIGLLGSHQVANAACAVTAATLFAERMGLPEPEAAIEAGLRQAVWPGRVEIVKRSPWVVIDGAHNPEGAAALRAAVEELFAGCRPVLVLGMLGDKDVGRAAACLTGFSRAVVLTRPDYPSRALDPTALAGVVTASGYDGALEVREPVNAAISRGLELLTGPTDILLIAGSLYLAAEARAILRNGVPPASGSTQG